MGKIKNLLIEKQDDDNFDAEWTFYSHYEKIKREQKESEEYLTEINDRLDRQAAALEALKALFDDVPEKKP